MIKRLQHRLDVQQKAGGKSCSPPSIATHKAAKAIEQLLYRSAFDFREYQDLRTLNDRMRSILAVRFCKRSLRRREIDTGNDPASSLTPREQRKQALISAMGSTQAYEQAQTLVNAIQAAKLKKVAEMKGCANGGACPYMPVKNEFRRDALFPVAVRDIFFRTPLVQAFERAPLSRLASLNWSHMIPQAQQHLQAFQQYNSAQKLRL
jgi:hypothetical protein